MADPPPPPPRRGFAIASLVLGILSVPTGGLLLVGAMLAILLGVVAIGKEDLDPNVYGGRKMAIAGMLLAGFSVLLIPVIVMVATLRGPSHWGERQSANEQVALADVRQFMAAETQYQKGNAGYFDTPGCLAAPDKCNPRLGRTALIDRRLLSSDTYHGYHRRFYPGPAAPRAPPEASRSSLLGFAFAAFPALQGRTGVRSFCGDSRGRLCSFTRASDLIVFEGACTAACTPVD